MKVLNLFAGLGGNRKLWQNVEVTAVESSQEIADVYKKQYPEDSVIIDNAYDYLLRHYDGFDFIWASPPCQSHSRMGYISMKTREKFHRGELPTKSRSKEITYPDLRLYELIIFLQHFCKDRMWIVENVVPYYSPLIIPTIKLDRHLLWSNFNISHQEFKKPDVEHNKVTGQTDRYGINLKGVKMQHRKDQLIRNCVNPKLGEHILKIVEQKLASVNKESGEGVENSFEFPIITPTPDTKNRGEK